MFNFADVQAATVDLTLRDDARPFAGPEEWVQLREARGAKIRRHHGYWMVTCPAHDDREPSLKLAQGRTQPVVFKCFAGCSRDDVLAADGLTWAHVLYRSARSATFASRTRTRRITALRLHTDTAVNPLLHAFSFVVLRCVCGRRGPTNWMFDLWLENASGPGASHKLVLPKGAGRTMGLVADDLVELANHRISNGELRAIPYSQRFGALRLDLNPGSVRRALDTLEERGVIEAVGRLPDAWLRRVEGWGPTLWALRVVPCVLPERTRRVERADRVSVFDFEPLTASEAPSRVRQPHAELGLEPGVTLADLSVA